MTWESHVMWCYFTPVDKKITLHNPNFYKEVEQKQEDVQRIKSHHPLPKRCCRRVFKEAKHIQVALFV